MSYSNQPYIVYIHEDVDRRHIHIVPICVNKKGEKIDDICEWNRSMKAYRELERGFGPKQVDDKREELLEPHLKKADYQNGNVKRQVSSTVKNALSIYHPQSFGKYSALLPYFNIETKQVKGEFERTPYSGVVYTITDDGGKPICTPVRSSLIEKRYGHGGLEKCIGYNVHEYKNKKWQPKVRNEMALAMYGCRGNREEFTRSLTRKSIDMVFHENDEGRIYGTTFIDRKSREVYNGSRFGEEPSANAFEQLFSGPTNMSDLDIPIPALNQQGVFSSGMEGSIEQAFGILDIDTNGPGPQEEVFARRLQHRNKKRRHSRGISRLQVL